MTRLAFEESSGLRVRVLRRCWGFIKDSLLNRCVRGDPHVTGNYDIRDYTADVAFPEGKNVFALTAGMTAVSHDPNILRDTLLGNRMHFVTSGLFGNPSGDMTPQQDSLLGVIICPAML